MKHMKTIKCSDFGMDCPFVAKDETEEGVVKKIAEHGMTIHKEEVEKMMAGMSEEEKMNAIKSKMKEEMCEEC